ncbi:GNAT family N-acetyltransferase [Nocardioides aurantiacus]|uniref:GNAT family N-acetyltransferase n=1 Tax=Nocardioides aurantiacus TaxID=86796 RepID=UPI00403F936B
MQRTLTAPRVVLRPWRADDVDAVTAACQDPEIQRWTQVPVPYERRHAEEFVGGIAEETRADGGALFAVELRNGDALVGSVGLFPPDEGVGEIGHWTVDGQRGRGLTSEAVRVLSEWALIELALHRVELHVDPANMGSRRVAERAGFHAEGVIRQRFRHRGRPADVVLYSRLSTDPRPTG